MSPKKTKTKTKAKAPAKPKAKAAPKRMGPRADLGQPVDGFFAKQPAHLRPVTDRLRVLIAQAAPDATASLKWGMPFYAIGKTMFCAVGAHKAHVNLILPGAPGTLPDPEGRLEGEGKTGQHLKLRALDELPVPAVKRWLATLAQRARKAA